MSHPDDRNNYITCNCQHCSGHIKFEANQLRIGETRRIECPHCHLETIIFHPQKSGKDLSSVSKNMSSKIELFLFELTRFPAVFAAILILVALIVTAILSIRSLTPDKLPPSPVISYEAVAPSQEIMPKNGNTFVASGGKMAGKNSFPQPVVDFLFKHVGFSLKEWLDQLKFEQRQAFLNNLAVVLQTASTKNLADEQLKQLVKDFGESWIAALKYEADSRMKNAEEKQRHFTALISVGFGLLTTLMILSLILVLLAIERNTRAFSSKNAG